MAAEAVVLPALEIMVVLAAEAGLLLEHLLPTVVAAEHLVKETMVEKVVKAAPLE